MDRLKEILKECGAVLEGHFLLSSGKHSNGYVQCARLFERPDLAQEAMALVAEKIKDINFDLLCGPAIGGIIASYELARQLEVRSIFTERKDGKMELRRGFSFAQESRILIVEDVVTTGKSSMETKEVLEDHGAEVIGIACVVNRSGKDHLGLPLYYGTQVDLETYDPDDVPEWLRQIPVDKPGSKVERKD